jgi:hypothetical protein
VVDLLGQHRAQGAPSATGSPACRRSGSATPAPRSRVFSEPIRRDVGSCESRIEGRPPESSHSVQARMNKGVRRLHEVMSKWPRTEIQAKIVCSRTQRACLAAVRWNEQRGAQGGGSDQEG